MTPDDLMKPRYKVIADYPGCPFNVGQILQKVKVKSGKEFVPGMLHQPDDYKANFQKLQWREERSIDQMPLYIKEEGRIWKLSHWNKDMLGHPTPVNVIDKEGETEMFASIAWHFRKDKMLPATREEYEHYKQKEVNNE